MLPVSMWFKNAKVYSNIPKCLFFEEWHVLKYRSQFVKSAREYRQHRNPGEQKIDILYDAERQQGDCLHHRKYCVAFAANK